MKKLLCLISLMMSSAALAAPKTAELVQIYERQNAAIVAGDMDRMLAVRTARSRGEMLADLKTAADREMFQRMSRAMVPVSYTVEAEDIGEKKASLYLIGSFKSMNPKDRGKIIRQEVILNYVKEGGQWKIDQFILSGKPDEVKRSPDEKLEPENRFDSTKTTSAGGRVVAVKFEKDYSLLTIRVLDEEVLLFLPAKAELEKSGLRTGSLVPGRLVEADGIPHKTNPRKILGSEVRLLK